MTQLADRNPPMLLTLDEGQFGDMKTIQSRWKTDRKLMAVSALNATKVDGKSKVWVRARVHTVRAKGEPSARRCVRRRAKTKRCALCRQGRVRRPPPRHAHYPGCAVPE